MNLKRCYLTKNNCYISGNKHTVRGILVHSTGCNNPYLKRYVAPDDGQLGKNQYSNHWNFPTPDGRQVCPHAFIGKLNDGTVATYQTLPWDMVGWHSGTGSKGAAANANNNGYVGFEICEDNLTDSAYFNAVYQEAVDLCVHLCKLYNLNPLSDGVLICHSEGYKRGIASNHGDVEHWFVRHGKSMDAFRADVKKQLSGASATTAPPSATAESVTAFKVGDRVKVVNAVTYEGKPFRLWYDVYDVISVSGDRVVIGVGGVTTAAVRATDIKIHV